jgi:hypothetical protein
MQYIRCAFLAFGLVPLATVMAEADDSATARALVNKAIKAHGGEATLAKLPAVTSKFKGKIHGMGEAAAFTGEVAMQGPDRYKAVFEAEEGGEKYRVIQVLNGKNGWTKFNDDTEELDKEDLADLKDDAHGEWVVTLVPLTGKGFTLKPLGEITIDKRAALGVKASSKGRRDIDLYFDKETGLLVKTKARVKDDDGQEVTEETFLRDYKEMQGTKQAMKFTVKRAGQLYLEGEITEHRLADKLDDSVFAKP